MLTSAEGQNLRASTSMHWAHHTHFADDGSRCGKLIEEYNFQESYPFDALHKNYGNTYYGSTNTRGEVQRQYKNAGHCAQGQSGTSSMNPFSYGPSS